MKQAAHLLSLGLFLFPFPANAIWTLTHGQWDLPLTAVTEHRRTIRLWPDRGIDLIEVDVKNRSDRELLVRALSVLKTEFSVMRLDFDILKNPKFDRGSRFHRDGHIWWTRAAHLDQVFLIYGKTLLSLTEILQRATQLHGQFDCPWVLFPR